MAVLCVIRKSHDRNEGSPLKGGQGLPGLEDRILRHVLSRRAVSNHRKRHSVHGIEVISDESLELFFRSEVRVHLCRRAHLR
jgi:hypothetical protein